MVSGEGQPLLHDAQPPAWRNLLHQHIDTTFNERRFVAKLLATSFNYIISGIAVTALGALIPALESYYHQKDGTIAAIFPCAVAGYLFSILSIDSIHLRLGRRGLGWLSSLFRLIALGLLSLGLPFLVCLAAYFVFGFGTGLTDAGWSAWAASLRYANVVQGPLHSSFGVGCIVGPMLAVAALRNGHSWYELYRLLSALVIVELAIQLWAFWDSTASEYQNTVQNQPQESQETENREEADSVTEDTSRLNPFSYRATWLCATFFFVYVAIEYTYSDWIVVFMRRARHMPYGTASLASSIFWLGMSVGRISLGPVTEYFGVRRSVTAYLAISACFQLLFQLTQHPAIALCMLGLNGCMLAPTFPSGLVLLSESVPKHAQVRAVSVAAAAGQIGGAGVSFFIGYMAERVGIFRLLDLVLTLTAVLIGVWLVYCKAC